VTGFDYVGVVAEAVSDNKEDEVRNLLDELFEQGDAINRKLLLECGRGKGLGESTVDNVVRKMVKDSELDKIKKGKEIYYTRLLSVKMDNEQS
jgi:DNA-binding transcriptional regulator PaaX